MAAEQRKLLGKSSGDTQAQTFSLPHQAPAEEEKFDLISKS